MKLDPLKRLHKIAYICLVIFEDIIGHQALKDHLQHSVEVGRIPHAQLFVGKEGTATLAMALAYANLLVNKDKTQKINVLSNPNVFFSFPIVKTENVASKPVCNDFLKDWRAFIKENPFGSLTDWYKHIGVGNKQGLINVDEGLSIIKQMALKSSDGGYKVQLIWMAETLNIACANKLLKLIEEPPEKTVFILIVEKEEQLINTIKSRCQSLYFNPLAEKDIIEYLIHYKGATANIALRSAQQSEGNLRRAIGLLEQDHENEEFEAWFIQWVRFAFKARQNKNAIRDLMGWSEHIAREGREIQKRFLNFSIMFFRQALLFNYHAKELVYLNIKDKTFKLENFAPFVNGANIEGIVKELEEAIYHIERNGNAKIVLTDLSIKLTRWIHKKA